MSSLTFASLLRAPNPGPMTLDGTNTWVLRRHSSDAAVIIDPGPADEEHIAAIAAVGPIEMILVTHRHHDHTEGIDRLVGLLGRVPVAAADPAWCRNAEPLHDNDFITSGGLSIEVLATPGHTSDSVCLVVSAGSQRAVCAGDTILGRGTTIVAWPDGNLADYLSSLDRLAEFDGVPVLTGHGPVLPNCGEIARAYRSHRNERLVQVRAAISAGARTPTEIVAQVYPDLEDGLAAAAESQVRAALAFLQPDGVLLPVSAAPHDDAVPHAAAAGPDGAVPPAAASDGAMPPAAASNGDAKADAAEAADVVTHPEPAVQDST